MTSKPIYPRISREQRKNCKLSVKDIKDIKIYRSNGETAISLAKRYNVSSQAIQYWSTKGRRKQCLLNSKITEKIRMQHSLYIKKKNKQVNKFIKFRRKHDIIFNQYRNDYNNYNYSILKRNSI